MHQGAVVATTIAAQEGPRPTNIERGNFTGDAVNYEKRAAELKTEGSQQRRPGLQHRDKSLSLLGFLTKSSRTIGQRGPLSKLVAQGHLSRSSSFGSIASGSVNGIFGDSGDSDLCLSDDEEGVTRGRRRSKRSPWMTLDQLSNNHEDRPAAIFDLKNNEARESGVLMDNLSVSNAVESDDFPDQRMSREDAFRSMEELDGSKSSILAHRFMPASPPRTKGRRGRRHSSIRRIIDDNDAALPEQTHTHVPMTTKSVRAEISPDIEPNPPFVSQYQQANGITEIQRTAKVVNASQQSSHDNVGKEPETLLLQDPVIHKPQQAPHQEAINSRAPPAVASCAMPPSPLQPEKSFIPIISPLKRANVATLSRDENYNPGPCFQQFTHFSIHRSTLAASIGDEIFFQDEGPRHLDAFTMSDVDATHIFPPSSENQINPEAIAQFCIPDGLRVRLIPRVALKGARRLGWLDKDCRYVFRMPVSADEHYHGVAVRVGEIVAFPVHEMAHFVRTIRLRQRRRWAATKICRWYKLLQGRDSILIEALRLSGFPKHPKDLYRVLTISDLRFLECMINVSAVSIDCHAFQEKSSASRIYEFLETSMEPFAADAGTQRRPSLGSLLTRGIASRQLATADRSSFQQRKRFGASTRMVKSERMRARTLPSSVVSAERRVSSERISFTPSFRKLFLSSDSSNSSQNNVPEVIKKRAKDSLETAEYAEMTGFVALVETCYTFVGCRPNEQVLLFHPMQQLVAAEREELNNLRMHLSALNPSQRSRLGKAWDAAERRVYAFVEQQRDRVLSSMLEEIRLTSSQARVTLPKSQLDAVRGPHLFFEAVLTIPNALPFRIPLPLPSITREWGLAKLLLAIGPESLMQAAKLLLLERSVLILGESLEEVTACCCALVELMMPFDWNHLFLAVTSCNMLNCLTTMKPFVAGLASKSLQRVESDKRVIQARLAGMSIINLSSRIFLITTEPEVSMMLSLNSELREKLECLCSRLHHLRDLTATSPLSCFATFVKNGLSPHERLTILSIANAFEVHNSNFCGSLGKAWNDYGTDSAGNGMFQFQPKLFLQTLRNDHLFVKSMVKTKHFSVFISKQVQLQKQMDDLQDREHCQLIASWIYKRWTERKCRLAEL